MPPRNHIVVGHDFSLGSRRAMEAAIAIARRVGGAITIVHALADTPARLSGATKRAFQLAANASKQDAKLQLQAIAHRISAGLDVHAVVQAGPASEALLAQADARNASLLVVGSSGKGFLDQVFLGSTAQDVVTKTTRPVMVVPRRQAAAAKRRGALVVGVTGDSSDRLLLEAATHWAAALRLQVHAVHAIQLPGFASRELPGRRTGGWSLLDDEQERLAKSLPAMGAGKAKAFVELGDASTVLRLHASRANARLIIVGKRARRPRWGTVLGDLVQAADRPLLVVPFGALGARTRSARGP